MLRKPPKSDKKAQDIIDEVVDKKPSISLVDKSSDEPSDPVSDDEEPEVIPFDEDHTVSDAIVIDEDGESKEEKEGGDDPDDVDNAGDDGEGGADQSDDDEENEDDYTDDESGVDEDDDREDDEELESGEHESNDSDEVDDEEISKSTPDKAPKVKLVEKNRQGEVVEEPSDHHDDDDNGVTEDDVPILNGSSHDEYDEESRATIEEFERISGKSSSMKDRILGAFDGALRDTRPKKAPETKTTFSDGEEAKERTLDDDNDAVDRKPRERKKRVSSHRRGEERMQRLARRSYRPHRASSYAVEQPVGPVVEHWLILAGGLLFAALFAFDLLGQDEALSNWLGIWLPLFWVIGVASWSRIGLKEALFVWAGVGVIGYLIELWALRIAPILGGGFGDALAPSFFGVSLWYAMWWSVGICSITTLIVAPRKSAFLVGKIIWISVASIVFAIYDLAMFSAWNSLDLLMGDVSMVGRFISVLLISGVLHGMIMYGTPDVSGKRVVAKTNSLMLIVLGAFLCVMTLSHGLFVSGALMLAATTVMVYIGLHSHRL